MKDAGGLGGRVSLREVEIVHNPALCAFLLWKVGAEYQEAHGKAMPMLLSFVVLPLLLHRRTLDVINSTNKSSGLALFTSKLGEKREDLLAVHLRALALRDLGAASLAAGVNAKMLSVDYETALVRALHIEKPPAMPERIKPMARGAERIGAWFSKLAINQVASLLRVDY